MIDAHLHFFDTGWTGGIIWPSPDKSYFGRKLPDDYLKASGCRQPNGVILVETSQREIGDQRLVTLARDHEIIKGIVANLRPLEDGFPTRLNAFQTNSKFKGIRLRPIETYDLKASALVKALSNLSDTGLTLELGAKVTERLSQISALADQLPSVTFVVTHAGHPSIRNGSVDPNWASAMGELSERANVWLKISPLTAFAKGMRGDRLSHAYASHMAFLLEHFGAERLLYGSNWPMSEELGSPDQHLLQLSSALGSNKQVFEQITEKTARRLYQLT